MNVAPRDPGGSWEEHYEYLKHKAIRREREIESSGTGNDGSERQIQRTPQAWLEFLEGEESMFAEKMTRKVNVVTGSRNGVSLYRLYELAAKTLPRSGNAKNEDYLRVYLGARQQMNPSTDDARDTFSS